MCINDFQQFGVLFVNELPFKQKSIPSSPPVTIKIRLLQYSNNNSNDNDDDNNNGNNNDNDNNDDYEDDNDDADDNGNNNYDDNSNDDNANDSDHRDDNDGDKQQQRPPRSHCRRGHPRSRRRHSAPQWPAPMRHPTPAAPTPGLGGSGGARPPRHAARPGTPASLPAAAPRPEAPAAPGVAKGVTFHKKVDFS